MKQSVKNKTKKVRSRIKKKAVVLYSGGLDSRLVVKLLQKKGYEIYALYFDLPFGCNACVKKLNLPEIKKLKIFNCKKGRLLKEYLGVIEKPRHGTGTSINPCKDCKIFMFKHAKKYADKHKIKGIATGEVVGQRPMSQTRNAMNIIDKQLNFKLTRPLTDMGFQGRQRQKQIRLAKKFKINYPTPAGGCLLCEKIPGKRIKFLLDKNLIDEKTLKLAMLARHFFISNIWFVVGRDEKENSIIETFSSKNRILSGRGKPAVFYDKSAASAKKIALELQKIYSKGRKISAKKFEKFRV